MEWSAFGRQHNIMKCNLLLSMKRKAYNKFILPVLTNGSQTWSLTNVLEQKLQSAQRGMERIMLGIKWIERELYGLGSRLKLKTS